MRSFYFAISLLFLLTSCHPEGRVYVEHQSLSPDIEWLKDDIKVFTVPIESTEQLYEMSISFRYAEGYGHNEAKIMMIEQSPSGKTRSNTFNLSIKDDEGNYKGDPGLDIWDSEHLVGSKIRYEEVGEYKYSFQHVMPVNKLHFAMEIGLILDETVMTKNK